MNFASASALSALCSLAFAIPVAAGPPTREPNIILMMADDLGYGDLSGYGSTLNRTPVLDRLANEGVRLTDYHAGSNVCTPSRMALLSGYYPRRVGWPGGVLGFKMSMKGGLASEVRTIAEVFKSAGYRTALVGKWHLGDHPDRLPNGQGFDESYFIKASNNQTSSLWRDENLVMDPFDNKRLTELFITESIAFIRRNQDRPFFLYLPFTAPHFPVEAHPDWKGKSKNGAFGDVVEELDSRIGDLMTTLEDLGIAKDTLVVFTSDNGPQNGRGHKTTADPWRGHKWTSLEGGTRVPCIFHWPSQLPQGVTFEGLTASIDILPTLAQAVGVPCETAADVPPLDGIPLWNAISGKSSETGRDSLLLWDGWASPQAIRVGSLKLFFDENELIEDSAEGPVLINLANDLTEEINIADAHPEKVQSMMALAGKLIADIERHSIPLAVKDKTVPKAARWLETSKPD